MADWVKNLNLNELEDEILNIEHEVLEIQGRMDQEPCFYESGKKAITFRRRTLSEMREHLEIMKTNKCVSDGFKPEKGIITLLDYKDKQIKALKSKLCKTVAHWKSVDASRSEKIHNLKEHIKRIEMENKELRGKND